MSDLGPQAMTCSVVSNGNLSAVPKDAFSTEISTATLAVPLTHPDEQSLDSVMRQSQVESASKEKNVLENSSGKSQIVTGTDVRLKRRKKRQEKGHDATKNNDKHSAVPKNTFSTETSKASLAVPPTHPDEHSLDSVMRQAQVENGSKEKSVIENSSDKSQIMTGSESSLTKKRRKKRKVKKHDAIESNDNLSAVPKDTFSTETSAAGLALPPTHPDEHSLDSVMRQSQVENSLNEKNVLENASDKSQIMKNGEVSSRNKRKRKRRQGKGPDVSESNDNLATVPKDAFSTENSIAALAVPPMPTHPDEHSLDSVMRQSQVENALNEKNVLENASDKSQITTSGEVGSRNKRKRKKRQGKRHDASESNNNLSTVPKDAFSTETSSAALAVPPMPTHPDEHSLDSVMRQSQVENALNEKNVLENASDKSQITTSGEVGSRNKRKQKKRQGKRHDASESNNNLSTVPKDAFSTETSTAALAVPPMHPDEHSLDSVMRQSQVENALNEKNVLENASDKSQITTSGEVGSRNKRKQKKRQGKRHDASESNNNLSTVPKDAFSTETSTAALAVPPMHPDEHSLDSVMRQSQVENALNEKNVLENASDKSQITTSGEVGSRNKRKQKKRQGKRHDASESNNNLSTVPKDAFSTETSTAALAVPPMHPDEHSLDFVMSQSQVENALNEKNVLENASDKSQITTSGEVGSRNKRKQKKRQGKRHDASESNNNLSTVPKDAFSTETSTAALAVPPMHPDEHSLDFVMSQSQVENALNEKNVLENASDKSQITTSVEVSLRNKRKQKKRKVKGHNASESNDNLSTVPKDTLSVETSTAPGVMLPTHPFQQSVDPLMRHFLAEKEGKENHVLQHVTDGYLAMTNLDVNSSKKNKKRKRKKVNPPWVQ
ncbi:hypothetical protein K1719_029895 [Acacia pycnantha]|nr:hypothetical protein K1719_029895 [Acacia pycnantha]